MELKPAILQALNDRLHDIALAKKSIVGARTDGEKEYLFRSAILTFYAALEGGIKEIAAALLEQIGKNEYYAKDLSDRYAYLSLYGTCKLDTEVVDYKKQVSTISSIVSAVHAQAKFPKSINVEANMTPNILNKVCYYLGIPSVLKTLKTENDLNILLRFRNNIAHGDRKMPIDMARIDQLSSIAVFTLFEFSQEIVAAYERKVWLSAPTLP